MKSDRLLQAEILVERLARLSADSAWAHKASGIRASLDRYLGLINTGGNYDRQLLAQLIQNGYEILEQAAHQIPSTDEPQGEKKPLSGENLNPV
jgi:hypothetical protein